jgi:hypothetical protein
MWTSLSYVKHVIFHPFDGFYDLKYEKRGSLPVAILIITALALVNIFTRLLTGYTYNTFSPEWLDVGTELLSVAIPYILFCVCNWAVTTLMEGEGRLREIFIYTAYAMVPTVIFGAAFIILSNVLVIKEVAFLKLVLTLGSVWSAFLVFTGTMTTHQYTVRKTIMTFILIVIAMFLILFVFALFFTLIDRFLSFVNTVYNEIAIR